MLVLIKKVAEGFSEAVSLSCNEKAEIYIN